MNLHRRGFFTAILGTVAGGAAPAPEAMGSISRDAAAEMVARIRQDDQAGIVLPGAFDGAVRARLTGKVELFAGRKAADSKRGA